MSRQDRVWTITLNRPEQHNRLDPADVAALTDTFVAARNEPLSLLVITGAGTRTFSSGYTLSAIASELDDRFEVMLDTLETLPFVTLAALNGSLYGGATDLALCCDIRLGTTGMRMFMPAARFGLHYYPGGLRRYVSRLGLPTASKLMLTGMTVDAEEMLRTGYLTELLGAGALAARVQDYIEATRGTEPVVVAAMKRHLLALAAQLRDAQLAGLNEAMLADHRASLHAPALHERLAQVSRK